MWVEEVMSRITVCLSESDSCFVALQKLTEADVPAYPVTDKMGKLLGVVTRKRLMEKFAQKDCLVAELPCTEAMEADPLALKPSLSLREAWTYQFESAVVQDETGRILGVLGRSDLAVALCQEVEYHLQDQVRVLEAILGSAQNGIIIIDNVGRVTTFNTAAQRFSHVSRERVVGHHVLDVQILDRSLTFGLLEALETGKSEYGKIIHVGERTYVLHRDPIVEAGQIIGAICIFQDISELEAVSQELKAEKERNLEIEEIVQSFADGVLVTDATGKVIRFNRFFEELSQRKTKIWLGKSIPEIKELGFIQAIPDQVRQSKKPVTRIENKGERCLLVTGSPVFDKDNVVRVIINLRDMTALNRLRQELADEKYVSDPGFLKDGPKKDNAGMIGSGPEMQRVFELVKRVAKVDSTVLLLGESGVGKEGIGKLLHTQGNRAEGPFIKINCGSIPEYLLESELFGYEPGAFTGAKREGKAGMFDLAHKGTLLLDEIGDFRLGLQPKLLRVLQEREFVPVGGTKPHRVNVRIIAATHKDLEEMIKEGLFREDLYFRLNVVPIVIPPLRQRREDIVPLLYHFRDKFSAQYGLQGDFSPEVIEAFLAYDWPGNVRELENMVERLMVVSVGEVIEVSQLPRSFSQKSGRLEGVSVHSLMPLKEAVDEVERQLIDKALEKYGSTYKAAAALEVNQSTIVRRMARFRRRDAEPPVLH